MAKIDQKENNNRGDNTAVPPMQGEFANWAGINNSGLQTIIDFGFVQPSTKGQPKSGIIMRRIILPPQVAKELGNILINAFKKNEIQKTTKNKN